MRDDTEDPAPLFGAPEPPGDAPPPTPGDGGAGGVRGKAARLLRFLVEAARLRRPVVFDIRNAASYRPLWLSRIPGWAPPEDDSGVWVKAEKREEPKPPPPPSGIADLLLPGSLEDKSVGPRLAEAEGEEQEAEEEPEAERLLASYRGGPWQKWREEHDEWEKSEKVYSFLYRVYDEHLKSSEASEMLLAFGLLSLREGRDSRPTFRHLLVLDAVLEFDSKSKGGTLSVRVNPEGANARLEFEMLESESVPALEGRIEDEVQNLPEENILQERERVDGILRSIANGISAKGSYDDSLSPLEGELPVHPEVRLAPAFIYRKRSIAKFVEAVERMHEKIEEGEDPPVEFGEGVVLDPPDEAEEEEDERDAPRPLPEEVDETYFLLPCNEEQLRIKGRLGRARGTLVQGPPGTGKSQTIANLICHLLATGKRILVVSKKANPLKVLDGLLRSTRMEDMCLSLIGDSASAERESMERSARTLMDKWAEFKGESSKDRGKRKKQLRSRLARAREKSAKAAKALRALREQETREIHIGGYSGTAAKIATRVTEEREQFGWFVDPLPLHADLPLSEAEFMGVVSALRRFPPNRRAEISLSIPTNLPEVSALRAAVDEGMEVARDESQARGRLAGKAPLVPPESGSGAAEKVLNANRKFEEMWGSLDLDSGGWPHRAAREIFGVGARPWQGALKRGRVTLASLAAVRGFSGDDLGILDRLRNKSKEEDEGEILKHALLLRRHAGAERGIERARLLLRKDIRRARRVLKRTLLDGERCSTPNRVVRLVAVLQARVDIGRSSEDWNAHAEGLSESYARRAEAIEGLHDVLVQVFALSKQRDECTQSLGELSPGASIDWMEKGERNRLAASCELVLLRVRGEENKRNLDAMKAPVAHIVAEEHPHPVAEETLKAIEQGDADLFARLKAKAENLHQDAGEWQVAEGRLSALGALAPLLMDALVDSPEDECWDERAGRLAEAWTWAQVKSELERRAEEDDLASLEGQYRRAQEEIEAALRDLALEEAWHLCMKRIKAKDLRSLIAWMDAMRRLGLGKGVNAPYWRRVAQKHLMKCRQIIPAMVMPMNRVWDTVPVERNIFDAIVVDEASQCDLEAFPLLYLGKKVLIVGDDQQISPEGIGISLGDMRRLQDKHLHDFEHREMFDGKSSLFDLGRLFYGGDMITLVEHFRCMPEIIEFSNRNFYSSSPLVPLRQFGRDRLPPLKHTFVEGGYAQGQAQSIINPPEAEKIVEAILEMQGRPEYAGKSVGVITLQGQKQADLLLAHMRERLEPKKMEEMRLLCGDPYAFQGDERDIILLSMVASLEDERGGERRVGALTGAADGRRFNVAASRARDRMHLFHSVEAADLHPDCFRRRLIEHMRDPRSASIAGVPLEELQRLLGAVRDKRVEDPPSPFESWFELEVAVEIARRGFLVEPQHEVAKYRIDLVVVGGSSRLAVECDGDHWHGPEQYDDDMHRQRVLERCGWTFFRVRESVFRTDKERALSDLWPLLENLGIHA